jgi:hypothetical protein
VNVKCPPRFYFEPLKLLNFDLIADPDASFHSNSDPEPAFQNNADPLHVTHKICGVARWFGVSHSQLVSILAAAW